MNVFYNTIVFVHNLTVSKHFYEKIIGLKVEQSYETIVFFENHFVIHEAEAIISTIYGPKQQTKEKQGQNNLLIYFETDDIHASYQNMVNNKVNIIHPIIKQQWGQQVFRFYDPDGHIVEIGEAMHLEYLKK
ncbi:MAG TPA: VOC family protein [Bacteroidales bacterium]